jgi:hypothetical protein
MDDGVDETEKVAVTTADNKFTVRTVACFGQCALAPVVEVDHDWSKIFVSKAFDPALVKNTKFFGLVRIGKLEPYYLEFHNLRLPVGIYNSTIISSDLGNNICIDNAHYLSHYIIGNEVMIANVNELATTDYAKFGNGIIKQGESEKTRVWMELCNENGGRRVIPFNRMLPADAIRASCLWAML